VAYLSSHVHNIAQGQWEDVKVIQELLRHSTAKMTLDTYTQALSPQKRAAWRKWSA
jgi:integrase